MLKSENIIKYFLFLIFCAGIFMIQTGNAYADGDACAGALTSPEKAIADTINNPGMFSQEILTNMHDSMVKIYISLSMLFMLGHGMMCYASEAIWTCGGLDFGDLQVCIFRLPHLSFYITGIVVYITAFFMTMSVGMYFLDISFKLGFAVLFLPVTIGLWPFSPTKDKFTDNLSIIISNAMLFAFLSVGVAYAVILIREGIIGDQEGWMKFWEAVDLTAEISGDKNNHTVDSGSSFFGYLFSSRPSLNSSTKEAIENSTEYMVSTFALDGTKIVVILFCLVFGFKIIASSVTDYLNAFFGDSVFGGSSPMHHMGTQAVGFVKSHTVDPAARLVKDIATTQAGRAVEGVGNGLNKMAQGDFSGIRNTAHAITHPRQTFNNAAQKVGAKANQAVQNLGNAATEVYDTMQILKPGEYSEEKRQENTQKFAAKMNNITGIAGKGLENAIAHGGGKIKNVLAHPATTLQRTGAMTNKLSQAGGTLIKQAHTAMLNTKEMPETERQIKIDSFNQKVDKTTAAIGDGAEIAGNYIKQKSTQAKTAIHTASALTKEGIKSGIAKAATAAINKTRGPDRQVNEAQVRAKMSSIKNAIQQAPAAAKSGMAQAARSVNNFTRPTANSLTAGNVLKGSAKAIAHPQQTFRTVKKLAKQEINQLKQQDGAMAKGRLILKRTGQIVMRSARGSVQEAASTATGITGNIFQEIGRSMQHHDRKQQNSREQQQAEKQRQEEQARDEQLRNHTIQVD